MKRAILYLLLPVLFFYSCKKERSSTTDPKQKTYKVSFDVSGFTQQVIGSTGSKTNVNSLKTDAVTGLAASSNFLYYRVYSASSGAIVDKINQDSSMANFGQIDDYLPAGTYVVVFLGSKNTITVNNNGLAAAAVDFPPTETQWPDTFFKKDTVTVSGGDVSQTVTMDRIVGQLTVKLTDALPANASTLFIGINEEYREFVFNTSAGNGNTTVNNVAYNATIPPAAIGLTGFSHSMFIMNDARPITVTIICRDAGGTIIAQAVVPGVTIQHNTQTILSGALFGTNTGLGLSLNQPFDPSPINVQF